MFQRIFIHDFFTCTCYHVIRLRQRASSGLRLILFLLTLKQGVSTSELIEDDESPRAVLDLDVTLLHRYLINQAWLGNPEIELDDQDVFYLKGLDWASNPCRIDPKPN